MSWNEIVHQLILPCSINRLWNSPPLSVWPNIVDFIGYSNSRLRFSFQFHTQCRAIHLLIKSFVRRNKNHQQNCVTVLFIVVVKLLIGENTQLVHTKKPLTHTNTHHENVRLIYQWTCLCAPSSSVRLCSARLGCHQHNHPHHQTRLANKHRSIAETTTTTI